MPHLSGRDSSWKMLLIALGLMIFGVFLMLQSSNMLFEMNPLSIVFLLFAVLFVFSGIVIIVIALTAVSIH
jgi:uncharacterized membrane protein HdeD (DUF308 family)